MVPHSGTALGAHGLRPLGLPAAIVVVLGEDDVPSSVLLSGRRHAVTALEERWRVQDGWWREEALARSYVRVRLDDERVCTLFHDDQCAPHDGWFMQRY